MGKTAIRNVCKVSLVTPAEQQPKLHNRWHPDIPFAGTIKNGETVKIECVCARQSYKAFAYDSDEPLGRLDRGTNWCERFNSNFNFLLADYNLGNNDSADDMKHVDLTRIHYLSGPFEIETAEPGDVLLVEIMDVQPSE
jgi:formamidase